jgi:imidazole glycerol-phosphate synthase subunit HisH
LKCRLPRSTVRRVIALIDYGAGNLHSVEKALRFLGADVRRVGRASELGEARAAVLPGVGAFDDCLNAMARQELNDGIRDFIRTGRPFLGICVGYQALFQKSEEFNSCAQGLGVFEGCVVRFPKQPGLKVPQIGWNQVEVVQPECPLYREISSGTYFYFVHSYFPQPADPEIIATRTEYGGAFASSVWKDNVYATQFHPEKSQKAGLRLLENFLALA